MRKIIPIDFQAALQNQTECSSFEVPIRRGVRSLGNPRIFPFRRSHGVLALMISVFPIKQKINRKDSSHG